MTNWLLFLYWAALLPCIVDVLAAVVWHVMVQLDTGQPVGQLFDLVWRALAAAIFGVVPYQLLGFRPDGHAEQTLLIGYASAVFIWAGRTYVRRYDQRRVVDGQLTRWARSQKRENARGTTHR